MLCFVPSLAKNDGGSNTALVGKAEDLKQYVYSPEQVGLAAWPSGELRLNGFDITTDPQEADVFVVPGNLSLFQDGGVISKQRLYKLPYLAGNEARHVVFDVSDNFTKSIGMPLIFIRCDTRSWMLKDDPGTIQFAWPVQDFADCIALPAGGFQYDVSFHGWIGSTARKSAAWSCHDSVDVKSDVCTYVDFAGHLQADGPELAQRSTAFRRSMKESRMALCPESIPGVLPYRFFEAMSAGRVPLLVSSDYCLPWADAIPYAEFCVFVPSCDARSTHEAALNFVRTHTDEQIVEKGLKARKYWEQYLDCREWPRTMGLAVTAKLKELSMRSAA